MYPDTEQYHDLSNDEVVATLRQSIKEALTAYPDYSTVAVKVHNEEQRQLAIKLTQEEAQELGDKCLRVPDRVIFVSQAHDIPLGKIQLFENYLIGEALERRRREFS